MKLVILPDALKTNRNRVFTKTWFF